MEKSKVEFAAHWTSLLHIHEENSSMADVIQRESFKGTTAPIHSSTGLISAPTQFHDGPRDFWIDTTGTCPTIYTGLSRAASYSGQDGTRYWAGQDLNDNGGNGLATKTLDFGPINITGFNNLNFTALLAAIGSYNAESPLPESRAAPTAFRFART